MTTEQWARWLAVRVRIELERLGVHLAELEQKK